MTALLPREAPDLARPSAPPALRAHDLGLGYAHRTIIDGLDLQPPPGAITAIVGANGCGKSTLLRGFARLLRPSRGEVTLGAVDISRIPTREVARTIGLLPQSPIAPEGLTVAELVGHGRHPHRSILRRHRPEDDQMVADALDATGTSELAARPVSELSGGQRQRVWIAMAIAQCTDILLLDEPTSFLDIAHQMDVLDLVREVNLTRGVTVVMVIHDLAMAARYADHLVALRDGQIVAAGPPAEVVTEEFVAAVFGVRARVIADPDTGSPVVLPRPRESALAQHTPLPVHREETP